MFFYWEYEQSETLLYKYKVAIHSNSNKTHCYEIELCVNIMIRSMKTFDIKDLERSIMYMAFPIKNILI